VNEARDIDRLVDNLFRRKSGEIVSSLTRVFGPADLALAEDAVQDALEKALRQWPFHGVPANPGGWLFAVARNAALDRLRRRRTRSDNERDVVELIEARLARLPEHALEHAYAREIADDQLAMIFTCCHPAIPADARIALTLKTVGGFGVREIAAGFLARESTIAQRLTRAKRRIREAKIPFAKVDPELLPERLPSVLDVLYLMFNEGYTAHDGDRLVRRDICNEALRLAVLIADHPVTGTPEANALCALFCFQAARFPTRQDAAGELLLLADQERAAWDRDLIGQGLIRLEHAAEGDRLSALHLEAGIASCHAVAPSFEATDWRAILGYYDQLAGLRDSPVVALNRAVALAMSDGPAAGLAALDAIAECPQLADYYLLPATRGELSRRLGDRAAARRHLSHALTLAPTDLARRFLKRRLDGLAADRP